MRVLYKALASVGMLALSTAAALGVRHLTIASRKRRESKAAAQNDMNNEQNAADSAEQTPVSTDNEVVESETEIHEDKPETEEISDNSQELPDNPETDA